MPCSHAPAAAFSRRSTVDSGNPSARPRHFAASLAPTIDDGGAFAKPVRRVNQRVREPNFGQIDEAELRSVRTGPKGRMLLVVKPGAPAPAPGIYEVVSDFRGVTGVRVVARKGDRLPWSPSGCGSLTP